MPAQAATALTNNPRWLFVHAGRNDLLSCFITNQVVPCYWPEIADMLRQVATNCDAHNANLLIGEVLPAYTNYTEWSTPGIHLLNDAYAAWANTNALSSRTRISVQHDAFGTINPETGDYDYLNPAYASSDGLHINTAAYDFWAPLLLTTLGGFYLEQAQLNGTANTLIIGP